MTSCGRVATGHQQIGRKISGISGPAETYTGFLRVMRLYEVPRTRAPAYKALYGSPGNGGPRIKPYEAAPETGARV
jgi:hypothetical protein